MLLNHPIHAASLPFIHERRHCIRNIFTSNGLSENLKLETYNLKCLHEIRFTRNALLSDFATNRHEQYELGHSYINQFSPISGALIPVSKRLSHKPFGMYGEEVSNDCSDPLGQV